MQLVAARARRGKHAHSDDDRGKIARECRWIGVCWKVIFRPGALEAFAELVPGPRPSCSQLKRDILSTGATGEPACNEKAARRIGRIGLHIRESEKKFLRRLARCGRGQHFGHTFVASFGIMVESRLEETFFTAEGRVKTW